MDLYEYCTSCGILRKSDASMFKTMRCKNCYHPVLNWRINDESLNYLLNRSNTVHNLKTLKAVDLLLIKELFNL